MIITKEHQEAMVSNYVKGGHTIDECCGFIDGLERAMDLVGKSHIPSKSIPYAPDLWFDRFNIRHPDEVREIMASDEEFKKNTEYSVIKCG